MKQRLEYIDIMQGMAIFLVVLGHQSVAFASAWYATFHAVIYSFHMGLFVFISGLLIRYTYRSGTFAQEFTNVKRKLRKFTLPYLLIGLIATVISHPWQNGLNGLLGGGVDLLFFPMHSPAMFLWYIYLLAILYLVSPLFFRLSFRVQCLVLVVSVPLTFYLPTDFLAINQLFRYFFFYCLGVICAQRLEQCRNIANGWLILSALLLAGTSGLIVSGISVPNIITGALSIPACFGLSKLLHKQIVLKNFFDNLSHHSFVIYLLQMFVINAAAIGWNLLKLEKSFPFSVFMLLSVCGALFTPIFISVLYDKLKIKLNLIP